MSIWKKLNFFKFLNEQRDLALLRSLRAQYSTLQSTKHWEDEKGRAVYIAKLERVIASGVQQSNYSLYYLHGLLGMSKYLFSEDRQGALRNLKACLHYIDFGKKTHMDHATRAIFIPDKTLIYRYLGKVCRKMKDYVQAEQFLDAGIKQAPDSHEFYMEKMCIKNEQKDHEGVLALCDKIDELQKASPRLFYAGDSETFWQLKGQAHLALNNFKQALECEDEIAKFDVAGTELHEIRKKFIMDMWATHKKITKCARKPRKSRHSSSCNTRGVTAELG